MHRLVSILFVFLLINTWLSSLEQHSLSGFESVLLVDSFPIFFCIFFLILLYFLCVYSLPLVFSHLRSFPVCVSPVSLLDEYQCCCCPWTLYCKMSPACWRRPGQAVAAWIRYQTSTFAIVFGAKSWFLASDCRKSGLLTWNWNKR